MTPPRAREQMPAASRSQIWIGIAILVLLTTTIAAVVSLSLKANGHVFLRDDPAVIDSTIHQTFVQWFTEGFAHYFYVFPEWTTPYTNFSRPLLNLILYGEYLLFSTNYLAYMSVYYVCGLFTAILIFKLCRLAGARFPGALLAPILCLISPAFISEGLTSPAYMFDVVSAAFVLFAMSLFISERFGAAVAILILAVLTKENAIAAPIAAALAVYLWKRRVSLALTMLLPLVIWALLRVIAFGSLFGGVYMSMGGIGDVVRRIPGTLLTWPAGVFLLHWPSDASPLRFIATAVQLALLAYVAVSGVRLLSRPGRMPEMMKTAAARVRIVSLIWLVVTLGYCIALGLREGRFGAAVCPLMYLFVVSDLLTVAPSDGVSWYRKALPWAAVISLFALSFVADFPILRLMIAGDPEQTQMQAFVRALRMLPGEGETVYVVNSPPSFSRPDSIARFLGLNLRLVYVDQVKGCVRGLPGSGTGIRIGEPQAGLGKVLTIRLPDCAEFFFGGANDAIMMKVASSGASRNNIGDYHFPDWHRDAAGLRRRGPPEFGKVLEFTLAEKHALVLAYHWDSGNYESISLAADES